MIEITVASVFGYTQDLWNQFWFYQAVQIKNCANQNAEYLGSELANEFQKKGDKSLTKIGKALENYSDAFGLFELLPGVGAPIAAVGKWGFSRLGQKIQKGLDELDVLKQKNQVIQLLSAQSNRVLVVLDDIDRLNNEQIRYIFQLITSVARFPNMTFF